MRLEELPLNNTRRKLVGRTEEGVYIFGKPEPLEKTEETGE